MEAPTPEAEAIHEPAATHAVCPLCGKSSSLKTFPSGPGTDVPLQAFRGRGRGRGFDVIPRGSALVDERLRESVLAKLRVIVESFQARGYPLTLMTDRPSERFPPEPPIPNPVEASDELAMARSTIEFLEREVDRVETALESEHELRRRGHVWAAVLRHRLDETARIQARLVDASHACARSLRQLRETTKGFSDDSIPGLVSGLRELVALLGQLKELSSVPAVDGAMADNNP